MAVEVKETMKEVAAKIKQFVDNAATMTVETWYVEISKDKIQVQDNKAQWRTNAHPVAMTEVKLDGDSVSVVPMRKNAEGAFELDTELLELHERNVKTATDYRAGILNSLVSILKEAL